MDDQQRSLLLRGTFRDYGFIPVGYQVVFEIVSILTSHVEDEDIVRYPNEN